LKPDFREQFRETASDSKTGRYKMNTKLYVGNLSFDTTENDLQDLFSQHGPVTEVNLITDRMSGRSRGFAFVTMGTPEAAQAAITALSGKDIQGRALTVNEARPREEHGGGGAGGGGRRSGGGGGGGRRQFSRE
jgi:RNA recognition motif-containing protein